MLVGLLLDLSHLGVSEEEPPLSVGAAARHQGEVDLLIYSENYQASSAPYLEGPKAGFTVLLPPTFRWPKSVGFWGGGGESLDNRLSPLNHYLEEEALEICGYLLEMNDDLEDLPCLWYHRIPLDEPPQVLPDFHQPLLRGYGLSRLVLLVNKV